MFAAVHYKILFAEYPDVLHVRDVQDILSISRHQVYHLIESKQIRGIKVGKSYKIPKVSVIDYFLGSGNSCDGNMEVKSDDKQIPNRSKMM
ncbi:helix-turn-helix domain-containing protein [Oscillospiraceae bacterium OttesenSCG-928-F05]|nr:helix-turn-helix domain-containing protein [Oscillospiraceae bacterium OttesenSCG-928-F05]